MYYAHMKNACRFAFKPSRVAAFTVLCAAILTTFTPGRAESESLNPYKQGEFLQKSHKYELAISYFNRAILEEKRPHKQAHAYKRRAVCQTALGKYREAEADLKKAIKLEPTNGSAYISRAYLFRIQQRYKDSLEAATRGIELDPEDADGYVERALTQIDLHKYKDAIVDCTKAIKLDATEEDALTARATAYEALGKLDLALSDLSLSIKISPNSKDNYFKRAAIYNKMGKKDLAENDIVQGKRYIRWGEL